MKSFLHKLGAWLSVVPLVLLPASAYAQLNTAKNLLGDVGNGVGTDVTTNNLPKLIGRLISGFLGVLGIIAVVYIIYAGYLWMTDGGDGAKIKKAKAMIGASIVGIVLIIAAYAIAQFVIDIIIGATK
ncbi:MAG: hypothetical protein AAB403_14205 [Planctomycetota bacterium]